MCILPAEAALEPDRNPAANPGLIVISLAPLLMWCFALCQARKVRAGLSGCLQPLQLHVSEEQSETAIVVRHIISKGIRTRSSAIRGAFSGDMAPNAKKIDCAPRTQHITARISNAPEGKRLLTSHHIRSSTVEVYAVWRSTEMQHSPQLSCCIVSKWVPGDS